MNLSKDLVAASAMPLLLGILAEGESYGYALIGRIRELSQGRMSWSEGMLYPVLHRLEAQGFVASRWRPSPTGRRRRYYRITSAGQAELQEHRRQWELVQETLRRAWRGEGSVDHGDSGPDEEE